MMVCVSVEEFDGTVATASYAPDRSDAPRGLIKLNLETGERTVVERSLEDDMPLSWYVLHAFRALEDMLSSSPVKTEGCSCWY